MPHIRLSGKYSSIADEWADGVDGAAVYAKKSGKSLLYLFKRGVTWRVGRKPGAQNVIVSTAIAARTSLAQTVMAKEAFTRLGGISTKSTHAEHATQH